MDFSPSSYMQGGRIGPKLPHGIKKMCKRNEKLECKVKGQNPCKMYKCSRKKGSYKKRIVKVRARKIPTENGRCPNNYKLFYEDRIAKISKKKGTKRAKKSMYKVAICVTKSKYSKEDLINMARNNNIKVTYQGKQRTKESLLHALKRKGVKL
jgi:hypothetical protein